MGNAKEAIQKPTCILKLIEFILCIVGWIIWYLDPPAKVMDGIKNDCVPVALCGFGIAALFFFIVYMVDETHDLLEILFLFFGGVYSLVAAIFVFIHYDKYGDAMSKQSSNFWLAIGIICLLVCVACIIDLIFKFLKK